MVRLKPRATPWGIALALGAAVASAAGALVAPRTSGGAHVLAATIGWLGWISALSMTAYMAHIDGIRIGRILRRRRKT